MSNFDPNYDNPFQAPSTVEVAPQNEVEGDAAAIRRYHLNHEASIQGIGSLYVLGGILVVLVAISMLGTFSAMSGNAVAGGAEFWLGFVAVWLLVGVGVLQFVTGLGMRKVRPWTKIPATIVSVLGLISIPIGTLLGIYTLYLLHSSKGRVVLAESYQDIIAVTPEIKYKTAMIVKVLAIILIAVIVLGIGAALFIA